MVLPQAFDPARLAALEASEVHRLHLTSLATPPPASILPLSDVQDHKKVSLNHIASALALFFIPSVKRDKSFKRSAGTLTSFSPLEMVPRGSILRRSGCFCIQNFIWMLFSC